MTDKQTNTAVLRDIADKGWGENCLIPKVVVKRIADELESLRALLSASKPSVAQDDFAKRNAFEQKVWERDWPSREKPPLYRNHENGIATTYRDPAVEAEWQALAASPAAPAQSAEPMAWTADSLYDAIEEILLHHRMSNLEGDDGEAYPLVDQLTTPGANSIESGKFEIRLICDAIYNEVLTVYAACNHPSADIV